MAAHDDKLESIPENNFRPSTNDRHLWTGRMYAVEFARRLHGQDWIAMLAATSGRTRGDIEWHLQEEFLLPDDIKNACEKLYAAA